MYPAPSASMTLWRGLISLRKDRGKSFPQNHFLSDPKSETIPYSVTATIYWMLTKCQGKVPSTLYHTIMQWRSHYPRRKWLREVNYFAQGLKLLSSRERIQIHMWFLDAMLRTSNYHAVWLITSLSASSSIPLRGDMKTPRMLGISFQFLINCSACLRQSQTLRLTSL